MDGNGTTTTLTYADPESLLTKRHYAPGAGVASLADTAYAYDVYGRRASMTDATGSQGYTYDDTDALLTKSVTYTGLTARTLTYGFYPDGSRQSLSVSGLSGSFAYSYDAAGRMTGLTNPFVRWVSG